VPNPDVSCGHMNASTAPPKPVRLSASMPVMLRLNSSRRVTPASTGGGVSGRSMDFVFTLHSHLPYVLNHGRWPHGSDWLCEAALDTYLPLLEVLRGLAAHTVPAPVTIGFTPVLANQLTNPLFVTEMHAFFAQRLVRPQEVAEAIRKVHAGQSLISPSMASKLLTEFASMAKKDEEKQQMPAPRLTDREMEVLTLVAQGLNNRDIAKELFISENTVKNHVRNILEKLHLHSRMEAVVYAVREKLLEIK
jgi:DNA-binding NarL/FixJ family response regulator